MKKITKSVLNRFKKAAIAGAIASMGLISLATPQTWSDIWVMFNILGISLVYGAVTGVLMAAHKWATWKD